MTVAGQISMTMSHARPTALRRAKLAERHGDIRRLLQHEERSAYKLNYRVPKSRAARRRRSPPLPALVLAALGAGICLANAVVILSANRGFVLAPILASISLLVFAVSGAAAASSVRRSRRWATRIEVGSFVGFVVSMLMCAIAI